MKLKINTLQDFDSLVNAIDESQVGKPDKVLTVSLWTIVLNFFRKKWTKLRSVFRKEVPSLNSISLGTYLTLCQTEKPSEFISIVCEDLHLESLSVSNSISCYYKWLRQLKAITEKFEKAQPNIKQDGFRKAIWEQTTKAHYVPAHIWLVDSIAKRFNKTYGEVYSIPVSDAIVAVTIDCCNAEYESRLTDHQIQQSKTKRK